MTLALLSITNVFDAFNILLSVSSILLSEGFSEVTFFWSYTCICSRKVVLVILPSNLYTLNLHKRYTNENK